MFVVREFLRNQGKLVPIQIPKNKENIIFLKKVTVVNQKIVEQYFTLN